MNSKTGIKSKAYSQFEAPITNDQRGGFVSLNHSLLPRISDQRIIITGLIFTSTITQTSQVKRSMRKNCGNVFGASVSEYDFRKTPADELQSLSFEYIGFGTKLSVPIHCQCSK